MSGAGSTYQPLSDVFELRDAKDEPTNETTRKPIE